MASLSWSGLLRELIHTPTDSPVQYRLPVGDEVIDLSALIGSAITVAATGIKRCIHCGRKVNKLFSNGYCYPCFTTIAECDLCIVKPHECHFHLGTCRDEQFAQRHCMIPHYVYLAFSSAVKVGLTRKGRQQTRWVDQGALRAILVAELPNRKAAGELEMEIARFMPDKTDWRKMLRETGKAIEVDLVAMKRQVCERLAADSSEVLVDDDTVYTFSYPRLDPFEVVLKSIGLDKAPVFSGRLMGIKGQYLIFDQGVFQVKKHSGYEVHISVSESETA